MDPRLLVGDDLADSEWFIGTLFKCAEFHAKEQQRKSKQR